MAFAASEALAAIIATDAAWLGGFHRLTIDNLRARLASAPRRFPHITPQSREVPGAVRDMIPFP